MILTVTGVAALLRSQEIACQWLCRLRRKVVLPLKPCICPCLYIFIHSLTQYTLNTCVYWALLGCFRYKEKHRFLSSWASEFYLATLTALNCPWLKTSELEDSMIKFRFDPSLVGVYQVCMRDNEFTRLQCNLLNRCGCRLCLGLF